MPFEEFVVVNRTEHKVQCAKTQWSKVKIIHAIRGIRSR